MREIKFKAWNKDKNDWEPVPYIITESLNPTKIIGFLDENEGQCLIEDNHAIVQYTGLKDKNGREIYEGDIVRFVDFDTSGGHRADRELTGVIKYQSGLYEIWKNNDSEFFDSDGAFILNHAWLQDDEFEIIGNIYENQELVGDTK